MLSILALSAALMQEPPAAHAPDTRTHVFVRSTGDGPGLDKDGDGQVTREEFAAPMSDAFSDLDKDGNGRLSTEELDSGHGRPGDNVFVVTGDDGPGAPHRFELRHSGGDGPGEDREVVILDGRDGPDRPMRFSRREGGSGGSRIEIRRIGGDEDGPDRLDKDGDGKVSEAEFTTPLRDAFARMDADHSGFIEESERGGEGDVRVFTHRVERRDRHQD